VEKEGGTEGNGRWRRGNGRRRRRMGENVEDENSNGEDTDQIINLGWNSI
jgi:hypothetical protein